ncbi:hypothetical protein SAMN05216436_1231 [bacterium A37T11]|nr:hypothetical protein SAMN05216436_1231 [bacterium A37T11]
MALSAVSTAKAAVWWSLKPEKREEFSMRTIKTMYHNKLIADRIFSNLGLELNCRKIKQIYEQCIYTGITAA